MMTQELRLGGGERRGVYVIIIPCQKSTFKQELSVFLKSINSPFFRVFFFSWLSPTVLCHLYRILVMKQVRLIHIPNKEIFAKTL